MGVERRKKKKRILHENQQKKFVYIYIYTNNQYTQYSFCQKPADYNRNALQLLYEGKKQQSLQRVRKLFEWRMNANETLVDKINDLKLFVGSDIPNVVEDTKKRLDEINATLQQFAQIDCELFELWKAQPRATRNKYKGVRKFLHEPRIINDRYSKEGTKLFNAVTNLFFIFIQNLFYFSIFFRFCFYFLTANAFLFCLINSFKISCIKLMVLELYTW